MEIKQWRENDTQLAHKVLHTHKGDLTNTTRIIDNVHTVWQTEHWCKSIDDVDKALSIAYEPVTWDISDYIRIKKEEGSNGLITTTLADPLWLTADLMDFADYTIWAMTETGHFLHTLKTIHERVMQNLKR